MNKVAIYPGTFDPITFGHVDVIKKGLKLFNKWSNCLRYQKVAFMGPMSSANLVFTLPTLGSLTKIIKCPRFFMARASRKFYRFYQEVA